MLSAACRYRPCTLRALFAVLRTDDQREMECNYIADMLYILARGKLKKSAPLKRLSDLRSGRTVCTDTRTEKEIAQHVIDRLRGTFTK